LITLTPYHRNEFIECDISNLLITVLLMMDVKRRCTSVWCQRWGGTQLLEYNMHVS
jgi:hypothetical protein